MNTALPKIVYFVKKYKLLHVLFWAWSYIDLVHMLQSAFGPSHPVYADATIIKLCQMLCVYFVLYFLIPRFLHQKKYLQFIGLVLLSLVISVLLILTLEDIDNYFRWGGHIKNLPLLALTNFIDNTLYTGFFFAVYTISDRYYSERRNNQLEKERLENELNFLKAQINPHFLFNALNSIYVLIEEDKKLASNTLLKFSGLLRYQLYYCNNKLMPLQKELQFLRDYADLEMMRNSDQLTLKFQLPEINDTIAIAPFILTAFVENAFKHKSANQQGHFVNITAQIKENKLAFMVSNTFEEQGNDVYPLSESGGIGLQNVYRRLELLYPNKHQLHIKKEHGVYTINLELELYENEMPVSR